MTLEEFAKLAFLFILGTTNVLPTLWGDFVFDDGEAIVKNSDVILPGAENFYNIFKHDFWGVNITHRLSHKSYRPLTTLSYRLDYYLWGKNPLPFHLIDLILHGVNCVLVFQFLNKCLQPKTEVNCFKLQRLAYWGAILFCVHPVHVEVLGAIVGRADLLASFIFLSSYCLIKNHDSNFGAITLSACAIVGALFKETAISLSILAILFEVYKLVCKSPLKSHLRNYLPKNVIILSATGGFVLWRLWLQDGPPTFQPYDNPPAFAPTIFSRVVSITYIWVLNVFLLLNPIWLCYDWSMGCVKIIDQYSDLRLVIVVIFVAICIRTAYIALKNRVIMIAAIIFVATFLPSSNLFFTVGFVLAERNLYLPSIGYSLFLAYAFIKLNKRKMMLFVIGMFYLKSMQRSVDWMDQRTLFESALDVCPNNAKVHYNLGAMNGELGNYAIAEKSYKTAILLRPDYYQAMNNLGNLLRVNNKLVEAESWLRKAVKIKNDFAAAWMNLGIVLSSNNASEALMSYQNALKFRKSYPDCEYNLGNLYLDMGDRENALRAWERAVSLKPQHSQAWINSVIMLEQDGRLEDAKNLALKGIKKLESDDTLQFILGNILGKLSEFENAKVSFEKAIKIRMKSNKSIPSKYYSNLGVLYHRWGKKAEAIIAYQKALKIDPQLDSTRKNLDTLLRTSKLN